MEEDIKVLTAFLLVNIPEMITQEEFDDVKQAIENLIKGYKELDKENTRQHELLGKIHEKYQKDYIPKSKVREKKEELKDFDSDGNDYDYIYKKGQYELCEELLQEGDK